MLGRTIPLTAQITTAEAGGNKDGGTPKGQERQLVVNLAPKVAVTVEVKTGPRRLFP